MEFKYKINDVAKGFGINAKKAICYCRAGITARGYQHVHLSASLFLNEVLKQACHKTGTYIFKRKGGTME